MTKLETIVGQNFIDGTIINTMKGCNCKSVFLDFFFQFEFCWKNDCSPPEPWCSAKWLNLDVNRRQQIVEGAEWQKTASNISTLEGHWLDFFMLSLFPWEECRLPRDMKENLYQKWRQESDVDLVSLLSSCIVHQKALTIFVPAKKKKIHLMFNYIFGIEVKLLI